VGTVVGFQNPAAWRRSWPRVYGETLEFVQAAEALGLDEVWLTEHHFAEDGYCPALLPVAGAIAARTNRIRIGTKSLLLPFHDPVLLAEEASVVDIVSGGRLDLGLAAGYRRAEFRGFDLDPRERGARMAEGLQVLRAALAGEAFEHRGRFYRYGPVRVAPPPVQQPLPLWLGGRSRAAMRRAAASGAHLQLADFVLAHAEEDYQTYAAALPEAGREIRDQEVAAVATVFVDQDPDAAWSAAGPHLLYQQNLYGRWFAEASDRPGDRQAPSVDRTRLEETSCLVGRPEEVAARIAALHSRVPFTHFSFWTLLPGLALGKALASLELFAREVAPLIRTLSAEGAGA
jgi:alkanesulfonate monooxygenase SsuD/methylene tetrahydromethanopterin reductase-like flavin-dependent oxidoreductase (luciferase family)